MYTAEIFKSGDNGYGFSIFNDGKVVIKQDFAPYTEGFRFMTKQEAEEYAKKIIDEIKDAPAQSAASVAEPPAGLSEETVV